MLKQKSKLKLSSYFSRSSLILVAIVLAVTAVIAPRVRADQFQAQINALKQDSAQKKQAQDQLGAQAASLTDTIYKLQSQINSLADQITSYQGQINDLQAKITAQEIELARQKKILGESIKSMYLEGQITTLEMLASSKDLSEFVDKQQYRNTVQNKIKTTLDNITELKKQLKAQKDEAEQILKDKQTAQAQLDAQRNENDRLLALTQDQQAQLDQQIKQNFSKIADLRRQQAIENAKLFGNGAIPAGVPGGGGYPGVWAFAPIDSKLDNWGMYNRECVSYTAWKVAISGRNMPGWGWSALGNAKQWPGDAESAGIPVDGTPKVDDVAISMNGVYGHAMYVEAVGADGSIFISDYNQQYDGLYREYWVSASLVQSKGLVFIHFP